MEFPRTLNFHKNFQGPSFCTNLLYRLRIHDVSKNATSKFKKKWYDLSFLIEKIKKKPTVSYFYYLLIRLCDLWLNKLDRFSPNDAVCQVWLTFFSSLKEMKKLRQKVITAGELTNCILHLTSIHWAFIIKYTLSKSIHAINTVVHW